MASAYFSLAVATLIALTQTPLGLAAVVPSDEGLDKPYSVVHAGAGLNATRDPPHDLPRDSKAVLEQAAKLRKVLDDVTALEGATSADSVKDQVGSIDAFATDNLRQMSQALSELSSSPRPPSAEVQADVCDCFQALDILGHLYSLDMETGESRTMSVSGITVQVNTFNPSEKFPGHTFTSSRGDRSIAISEDVTFPSTRSAKVTLVSYEISGVSSLLPTKSENETVGSDVIGASFLDHKGQTLGVIYDSPVAILMSAHGDMTGLEASCYFMDYRKGHYSGWSDAGCSTTFPAPDGVSVQCECHHLTSFSYMSKPMEHFEELGPAAYIGAALIILFSLLTALVFIGYRLIKTLRCFIRLCFLGMLAMAEILFIAGLRFRSAPAICTMVAVGIQFFSLSSFAWLLSYTLFLGNEISGESSMSLHLTHYSFLGWAVPLCVVMVSFIWRHGTYTNEYYCWISDEDHLSYAWLIPIAILVVITLSVLLYVVDSYIRVTDPKHKLRLLVAGSGIRSCCFLLPGLSATWIIAHFTVMLRFMWLQILLMVVSSILGIMVFLFMFYLNEEVRMARGHDKGRREIKKVKHVAESAATAANKSRMSGFGDRAIEMKMWPRMKEGSVSTLGGETPKLHPRAEHSHDDLAQTPPLTPPLTPSLSPPLARAESSDFVSSSGPTPHDSPEVHQVATPGDDKDTSPMLLRHAETDDSKV